MATAHNGVRRRSHLNEIPMVNSVRGPTFFSTVDITKEEMDFEDPSHPRRAVAAPSWIRWRYVVAVLGSMGIAIIYGLRVNLHISIVAMVNRTAIKMAAEEGNVTLMGNGSQECHHESTAKDDGPFPWSFKEQGFIKSSYFIGYFITQVPGGRLAELWSGKLVLLIAVLMNAVGALLTPIACESIVAINAVRIFQGLGAGFSLPAGNRIIYAWAPSDERSSITSIIFGGAGLGTVLSLLLSGVINGTLGWAWTFYIQGGSSLIWAVLWFLLISDGPGNHKWISEGEKQLILSSYPPNETGEKPAAPWGSIFTSPAFLALAFCHACNNTGWLLFMVEVPKFLKEGLCMDGASVVTVSTIPFFTNYLFSVFFGMTLDFVRGKGYISVVTARKIAVGTASLVPALCLLGMNLTGKNEMAIVLLMIMAITSFGAMFSGVLSNHNDLAPNFGGILMGITSMAATIPGIVIPIFVGAMTEGVSGLGPWSVVFNITVLILVAEFAMFTILGKGEVQPWNEGKLRRKGDCGVGGIIRSSEKK